MFIVIELGSDGCVYTNGAYGPFASRVEAEKWAKRKFGETRQNEYGSYVDADGEPHFSIERVWKA